MKKKVVVIVGSILLFFIVLIGGVVGFYFWGMNPKENNFEPVIFKVEPGTSKLTVAKNLEKAGLIRNEFALDLYLFFNNVNIQAGDYELSKGMKPEEMIAKFTGGDVKIYSSVVTLVEGLRLTDYAEQLADKFEFTEEEFLQTANDKEFLNTLLANEEYWFLSNEILNEELYYPLEGYLYPDTYEFLDNVSCEEVITTILSNTAKKLEPIKDLFHNSPYTIHQILTMASIVEKEATNDSDRATAAQVLYTRLENNWSLGSDVTAFYGAREEMSKESETWEIMNNVNPYNTRLTDGTMNGKLPIGPICSPSIGSIQATLSPSNTNYFYFLANSCTGEMYFLNTASEFNAKARELSDAGCL